MQLRILRLREVAWLVQILGTIGIEREFEHRLSVCPTFRVVSRSQDCLTLKATLHSLSLAFVVTCTSSGSCQLPEAEYLSPLQTSYVEALSLNIMVFGGCSLWEIIR